MASSYEKGKETDSRKEHKERHEDCIPLIDYSLIASIHVCVYVCGSVFLGYTTLFHHCTLLPLSLSFSLSPF